MTYHRFSLSNSSFEQIDVDQQDIEAVLTKYGQYKTDIGYSLVEWSEKLGFGKKKTLKQLKSWVNEGKMRVVKIPILDITGRLNYSFVYVLKGENGSQE